MNGKKASEIVGRCLCWVICIGLFLAWLYLYFNQSIISAFVPKEESAFGSDLPAHLVASLRSMKNYSIEFLILRVLVIICKGRTVGVAFYLALVSFGTIFANRRIIIEYLQNENLSFFLAILLLFTAPLYLPIGNPFFYIHQFGAQAWHNDTSQVMKLLGILSIGSYLKIDLSDIKNSVKELWQFAILLTLTNAVKPSFSLAFIPAVMILTVIDILKKKEVEKKNVVYLGMALIPSIIVTMIQYFLAFTEGENGGVEFGIAGTLQEALLSDEGLKNILFFLPFPLFAVFTDIKKASKSLFLKVTSLMSLISIGVNFLVHETGERSMDGNFGWSVQVSLYLLMMSCVVLFFDDFKQRKRGIKIIGCVLCSLHMISGILYFLLVLVGVPRPWLL